MRRLTVPVFRRAHSVLLGRRRPSPGAAARRSSSGWAPSPARCSPSRSWTGPPTTCSSTSTIVCSTATQDLQAQADAGREWKIVNDTTWEFKLRHGVKFHNGEPFTRASVKATIDYALDPATKSHFTRAAYWGLVKEVQIVDDYTVRFVTKQPWPNLADSAASTNSLIMPAKALKELGPDKLAEKPIGTGPFRFVEWKRDERLVVERNPDYWQGPADVSRVTFRFIPEFSARMAALLSGEIDIMKDVPPHAVEAIEKSGRATLRPTVSSRINYLALVNLKPGPMQDLRVRRAMNHAVDVDELIKQVLKGRATRMCGPMAPPTSTTRRSSATSTTPPAPRRSSRRLGSTRDAPADPRHAVRPLPARQGRVARDRGPAPARRAQGERGRQRVGHAPGQDQEPQHR